MSQEEVEAQLSQLGIKPDAGPGDEQEGHDPNDAAADTSTPEEIAEAQALGWIPKDQYKGDETKWKPAKDYLEYGRGRNTVLNERVRTLLSKTQKQEETIADLKKGVDEARDFFSKVEQRAYEKAVADLKAQKREALLSGDADGVIAADDALAGLAPPKPREEAKPTAAEQPAEARVKEELLAWAGKNPWVRDPEIAADFQAFCISEWNRDKTQTGAQLFDRAAAKVKRLHPHLADDNDPRGNGVEGGGRSPAPRPIAPTASSPPTPTSPPRQSKLPIAWSSSSSSKIASSTLASGFKPTLPKETPR